MQKIYTWLKKMNHLDDTESGFMDNVVGAAVTHLGSTKVPQGQHPVLLFNGEVSLQTQSGKLIKLILNTHDIPSNVGEFKIDEMKNEEHQRLDDLEFIVEVRERRRNRQASI